MNWLTRFGADFFHKYRNDGEPLTPMERNLRLRLIFQDAVALIALMAIIVSIAVLTFYFFRSFRDHQQVLERRWYARGERAMADGDPQYAVQAYRSALSLSTANPTYELALAEALAASNRNQAAYAYFSSLHAAQPGDGYLNLQLARLAVKRMQPEQAIAFYRAALNGLWHGHGSRERFKIQLELARYLMSLGKNAEAQGDLLAAEGDSLDHPTRLLQVADLLRRAGDPTDAWTAYRRVEVHSGTTFPQQLTALQGEVHVAVSMGQYKRAAGALRRYLAAARRHPSAATSEQKQGAREQLAHLERLMQFVPFSTLSPYRRAKRLLRGAKIARQRYKECAGRFKPKPGATAPPKMPKISAGDAAKLAALGTQWTQFGRLTLERLTGDESLRRDLLAWTGQVEKLTAGLCGAPTGDDAILLQLAHNPDTSE